MYASGEPAATLAIVVLRMRKIMLVILLGGVAVSAQSMLESAAAAAGGSAGGAAGKKVSEGITKIFNKVDQTAGKSADEVRDSGSSAPLLEVGPGVPKRDGSAVPPPPPVHHAAVHRPAAPAPAPAPAVEAPIPVPPPPPPPEVTAADLKQIAIGMRREDVLKLGEPSSRITMFEDDHLTEVFHYVSKDTNLGVVRLTDGAVSSVQRP